MSRRFSLETGSAKFALQTGKEKRSWRLVRTRFRRQGGKTNPGIALRKEVATPLVLEKDDRFAGGIRRVARAGWKQ